MQFVLAAAVAVATGKGVVATLIDTYETFRGAEPLLGGMFDSKWWLASSCIAGIASALLAPVAALMSLGLVVQGVRVFQQGRRRAFTSLADWFHWCVQWLGRIGLAAILLGCVLVDDVFTAKMLDLSVGADVMWPQAASALRRALLVIGMIACLGWNRTTQTVPARRGLGQRLFGIIILPPLACWALFVWGDSSLVHRLVHIAVVGMEVSAPLKFADPSISVLPMERVRDVCQVAGLASLVSLISVLCCDALVSSRTLARRWRLPLAATLVAGWGVQAAFLRWVYWDGFHLLSPAWGHEIGLQYRHVAWTALAVILLLAAMVAYRGSVRPSHNLSLLSAHPKWYFHESRLALVLITLGAAGQMFPYVYLALVTSEACLWLALFVFGSKHLWHSWRGRCYSPVDGSGSLPPCSFFGSWVAAALTLALAAPTLGLFSFVFWLGPVNWLRVFE